jgi:hypothetical protein
MIFVTLVAASPVWAQPVQKKDTTVVLLADLNTQLECTQALADLYNFKFPQAEYQFKYLKARYKWHPLPYFLMGLIQWWKIMPNTQNKEYDDIFLAYMDSTINVAEDLIDDYPAYKTEGEFFLAAAYLKAGCILTKTGRTGAKQRRQGRMHSIISILIIMKTP